MRHRTTHKRGAVAWTEKEYEQQWARDHGLALVILATRGPLRRSEGGANCPLRATLCNLQPCEILRN